MKIVKVLYLDDDFWIWYLGEVPDLSADLKKDLTEKDLKIGRGMRLEVIREHSIVRHKAYHDAPEPVVKAIKTMTENKEVDIVVVGNNWQNGLTRAREIAEDLKPKTIVVWHDYQPGAEKPYAELGFQHFCRRRDLRKKLKELLGIKEKVKTKK
jgi:hypothetical protein